MEQALAKGLRRLAHLDLPGGGQVSVEEGYAFIGHMRPPHGTTIVDVRDPAAPRVVAELGLTDRRSHTHKVRVAGHLMVTNVEMNERHAVRSARDLAARQATLEARLGRPPSDGELCRELGIGPAQLERVRDFARHPYEEGGFKVWDVANRAAPRLLAHVRTHGFGVHRFDLDRRYAYISTEMEGFVGNILVIYDLADPARPKEVARWWLPGQHAAGGETPTWSGYKNRLHHALRHRDELWAAVWNAGIRVIDIADIRRPTTIGAYDYHPPFPEPTHTVVKVPFPVAGRDLAVAADEEHDHVAGQPHAGLWVLDVARRDAIRPLSMFHLSERASPFVGKGGRFGMHQFQERLTDTRLYCAWFAGGLRVIDVKDPMLPVETGFYIPEPCGGEPAPQSNDVAVDERGLVYLIDRNTGFDVLEPTA